MNWYLHKENWLEIFNKCNMHLFLNCNWYSLRLIIGMYNSNILRGMSNKFRMPRIHKPCQWNIYSKLRTTNILFLFLSLFIIPVLFLYYYLKKRECVIAFSYMLCFDWQSLSSHSSLPFSCSQYLYLPNAAVLSSFKLQVFWYPFLSIFKTFLILS